MYINGTLTIETKKEFGKFFAQTWRTMLKGMGMTSKQYDPHGTKKPAEWDAVLLDAIKHGDLPAHAIDWAQTAYGRNKIAALIG